MLTGSDVTEVVYFNVAMGWQVPIHRSPIVSLHLNILPSVTSEPT